MKATELSLSGVLLFKPWVFHDERGFFAETWNRERYAAAGLDTDFVQDNVSLSKRGVLRGLHYQNPSAQGKLVSVLQGAVFDVAVDLRVDAPTFKKWVGVELSSENLHQLYVPEVFAHGFLVTSETAVVSYKCTAPYVPEHERSVRWDDPEIGIEWPIAPSRLSVKDGTAPWLRGVPREHLFGAALGADGYLVESCSGPASRSSR